MQPLASTITDAYVASKIRIRAFRYNKNQVASSDESVCALTSIYSHLTTIRGRGTELH